MVPPAPTFKKCSTILGTANLPVQQLMLSPFLLSRKRISLPHNRSFTKQPKSKDASVALSAKYFEARCLESTKRADDALTLYLQVAEAKSQYREDARTTAGAMLLARGRRTDALKQYEALAGEAEKPAAKAEAAVRAGLIALDLAVADRAKIDSAMAEKARSLLQKGRTASDSGKWKGVAQAGLLRLEYQTGQFAQIVSDYKKSAEQLPDEAKP